MKIQFKIYGSDNAYGDEPEEYAEDILKDGLNIPLDKLIDYLATDPLYEIEFTVEYDTETEEFEIIDFKSTH